MSSKLEELSFDLCLIPFFFLLLLVSYLWDIGTSAYVVLFFVLPRDFKLGKRPGLLKWNSLGARS